MKQPRGFLGVVFVWFWDYPIGTAPSSISVSVILPSLILKVLISKGVRVVSRVRFWQVAFKFLKERDAVKVEKDPNAVIEILVEDISE